MVRSLQGDVVLVLAVSDQVGPRSQAREAAELVDQMGLVVIAAAGGEVCSVRLAVVAADDLADDLLEAADAGILLRR